VDIALKGKNVNIRTVIRLADDLNEKFPLPYFFDVLNYNEISNDELKNILTPKGE